MNRRHFLGLSALAVGGGLLSGCGGGGSSGENPSTLQTLAFFTDKAAWEPTFNAMNEVSRAQNLELKFTGYSDPTAYDSFVKQSFRTRKVPDLFTWHTGSQLEELVQQKLVAETTEIWQQAKSDKVVPDGLVDNYTVNGKQYGVPLNIAYWVMYYNKKVFQRFNLQPPKTWADLMTIADTLVENGVTPFQQMNIIFEFVWFQAMLIGQAPEVYRGLQTGQSKYTDPEVVKVCQQWSEMIGKKYFNDPGLKTDPQTLLKNGETAMAYYGTFFTGQLTSVGAKSGEDYGVFLVPNMNPAVTKQQVVLETGPMLVGKGSEHEDAALAYGKWWMRDEAQNRWSATRGDISFNPNVKVNDPELSKVVSMVNDKPGEIEVHKRYLEATPLPVYTVETEVFGKLVTDGGDPMPALTKLQEAADKYWAGKR